MGRRSDRRRVLRVRGDDASTRPDTLAVEEPLEIRVDAERFTLTMRTPGDDFELAAGHLVSEGTLAGAADVRQIRYCDEGRPDPTYNVLDVTLADGVEPPASRRQSYMSSACGVCGKDSLDAVRTTAHWSLDEDDTVVPTSVLALLPDLLRESQAVFERTGGLHAAGLFTADGELLCLREDVGRHNAVDKVVGWAVTEDRLPLRGTVLQVSGRASFELVQKAWMAGIPILSAVSAPSTLAVDLAAEAGLTLVGFARGSSMNVYTGLRRVATGVPDVGA
ncbi:formate dehydrogenase accessory sulfurtransferase FdhD [Nocardioides donggukensis]|uniref:Sulfur carrier protein FdhD n=1 Tax=Nocardioides donggukensis TaxID=2774019 RepID=A0A927K4N3_9ACTN|nr:formate dehydrogenase accessory sulfurtransferase FdhD [Nocardioides donggukensis]MBD8870429.1 formate dehydrogenase accessory sulfurtransferase FdhD [Nocardioides donggukensis]